MNREKLRVNVTIGVVLLALVVIIIVAVVTGMNSKSESQTSQSSSSSIIPTTYQLALDSAKEYAKLSTGMSKQEVYDQLISEVEKFSPEAAQYAVDNLEVDWNQNALTSAKGFQKMGISKSRIYETLTKNQDFTPEQAQYAIDNLPN